MRYNPLRDLFMLEEKAASGSNTDYLIKYGRFIKVDLVQKSLPNEKSINVPLMS